jgi:hypothetical protein
MVLDGSEGGGEEQNVPKVHGSPLGWSSGDVLINSQKVIVHT